MNLSWQIIVIKMWRQKHVTTFLDFVVKSITLNEVKNSTNEWQNSSHLHIFFEINGKPIEKQKKYIKLTWIFVIYLFTYLCTPLLNHNIMNTSHKGKKLNNLHRLINTQNKMFDIEVSEASDITCRNIESFDNIKCN